MSRRATNAAGRNRDDAAAAARALVAAVESDDADAVRRIYAGGAVGAIKIDKAIDGLPPLLTAAAHGAGAAARALLDCGADINVRSGSDDEGDRGLTSLMLAAEAGNLEMVDFLLDAGADPRILTRQGRSAINFSIETTHEGDQLVLVERMLRGGVPPAGACVARAAESENLALARMLIAAGADVNVPSTRQSSSYRGVTAPTFAVRARLIAEECRALHKAMGRPEETDRKKAEATQLVRELIRAGADIHADSALGAPMELAVEYKDDELAKIMSQETAAKCGAAGVQQTTATAVTVSPSILTSSQTAAGRAGVGSREEGARDFLKMLFDGNPEWAILAIESGIDDVVNTFGEMHPFKHWQRQVPIRQRELTGGVPLDEMAIVQLRGSNWTVIIRRLFEIDAVDLQETPADAKALSGRLKTRAATFMGEDASSAMGYELWRDGERVESIQWSGGAVSFESALRQAPSWPGDDFAIADAIFAELGVYLPCCYGQADEGGDVEAHLAADPNSESRIDRADLVTL